MPELPEVETVRKGLERLVVNQEIASITIKVPKMVKTDLNDFMISLPGKTIQQVLRRGKYLLFDFGEMVMVSHLRMEGKYLLFPNKVPDNKHFHLYFKLTNGSTLVYQDVRKFGTFELVRKSSLKDYFTQKKLGPEPTADTFQFEPFSKGLANSKKPIKTLLLDQRLVAGLGNIYVDEVLWAAKIHPQRLANQLTESETSLLHKEIIRILTLGIEKGGSTIRTYKNALGEDGTMQKYLQVYGKTGQPCPRCGCLIKKIKVGGRGTHYCPRCQCL